METSMVPIKMSQNMGNNGLGVKLDITHGAGWNLSRVTENRQVYTVRFQAAGWFRGLNRRPQFCFRRSGRGVPNGVGRLH